MRKDCALASLSHEQQVDLFDWLCTSTYEAVRERLAKPPPDGFGIRTHINSLYRFYQERQEEIRARDLAIAISASERNGASGSQSFLSASEIALAHSAYMLAHSPVRSGEYRAVARVVHQLQDASLRREYLDIARDHVKLAHERLQLNRTQFEYNAARAAIALLPELIAIDRMTDIDDEAKIWRVRDRLFGAPPSPAMLNEKGSVPDPQSPAAAESNASGSPSDSPLSAPSMVSTDLR